MPIPTYPLIFLEPKKEMPTPFTTWFWRGIPSWDLQMPLGSCPILPWNFGLIGWIKDMEKAGIILFLKAVQKNRSDIQISRWTSILKQNRGDYFQMNATNGTLLPQVSTCFLRFLPSAMIDIQSIASNFPWKKNHLDIHSWIPPL